MTMSVSSVFVLCSSLGVARVPLPDSASVFSLPGGRTQPEEGYESSLEPESIFAEQEEIPADAGRRRGVGRGGERDGGRAGGTRGGGPGGCLLRPPRQRPGPSPAALVTGHRSASTPAAAAPLGIVLCTNKGISVSKVSLHWNRGLFSSLQVRCPGARDRRVRKSHLRLEQIVETSVAVATKTPC